MSATTTKAVGKSWADDMDDSENKSTDFTSPDGVRTTITYFVNDQGKKVKVTRKTRLVPQKAAVNHDVARRLALPKFGLDKGKPSGPDHATTTVGEPVSLKLSIGGKASRDDDQEGGAGGANEEKSMKEKIKAIGGKVACRLCKGDHFTAKCPYKDTLGALDNDVVPPDDDLGAGAGSTPSAAGGPAASGTGGGKYVPPSVRSRGAGDKMGGAGGSRDDLPTLRITNISEDTQEEDLKELFGVFGRVARVYVGRDRGTRVGKGFAFVSFDSREAAQKAIDKVNGRGYDNLILSVGWSQPRPEGR